MLCITVTSAYARELRDRRIVVICLPAMWSFSAGAAVGTGLALCAAL